MRIPTTYILMIQLNITTYRLLLPGQFNRVMYRYVFLT